MRTSAGQAGGAPLGDAALQRAARCQDNGLATAEENFLCVAVNEQERIRNHLPESSIVNRDEELQCLSRGMRPATEQRAITPCARWQLQQPVRDDRASANPSKPTLTEKTSMEAKTVNMCGCPLSNGCSQMTPGRRTARSAFLNTMAENGTRFNRGPRAIARFRLKRIKLQKGLFSTGPSVFNVLRPTTRRSRA